MLPDLTFGSPFWWWVMLTLPLLAGTFLWAERQAVVRMTRLIQTPRLRAQLTGATSAGRRRARYLLLLGALTAFLVALAAPRLGSETRETHRRGLDLLFVVDVSKSMLGTDLPPTRLARARLAVQDFVAQLQGDRVGLVAFAGTAFLQAPLTVDYDAVLNTINELDMETIPRGGTNLGAAIDLATDAFGKAEAGNRAVVLLSDGEPTVEGEAAAGIKAAQHAAEAGVRIYTLGFGTPEGSLIPLGSSGSFVRDAEGKIVRTKLDEGTLKEIARAGNGFYVRFNGDGAIRTVVQQGLGHLKAGEIDAKQATRPIERYQWPLGVGLLLLTAAGFLGERRRVRAPLSPGPRAVPTGRRAAATTAAVVVAVGWIFPGAVANSRAEEAKSSNPNALELYKSGKYDEAYKAFQEMAEKHPGQENLEFNAGASAYKGKQYDEALDAFGKAMTSDNVDLQAKANYNFGNTLFRRGTARKDQDRAAKISDYKSALEHYDATLNSLKPRGSKGDPRLNADTAFNRAFVQQQLDELLKQPPPQDPQDKKDDKQPAKPQDPSQKNQKQDKDKQNQDKQDGNQPPKEGQFGRDAQPSQDGKQGQQPPQGDPQKGQKQDGNQAPTPSPDGGKPQGSQGDKPEASGGGSGQDNPPEPGQGKPRERGDFQAKPGDGQPPKPTPDEPGKEAGSQDEPGKMNALQARALLDSLKGEDAHVTLGDDRKKRFDDEPPARDW